MRLLRARTAVFPWFERATPIPTTSIPSAADRAADATPEHGDPLIDSGEPGTPESGGKDTSFRMGNLGRHSLIYGLGILLTKAVAFLMLPIYTRFLTPTDYGILQLTTMILEVVTIFAKASVAISAMGRRPSMASWSQP